jgi:hypothetical protein
VTVSTILTGIGALLALAGILIAVVRLATAPARYARPVRMDAEFPAKPPQKGTDLGVGLICVGAALLMVAAYRVI